MTVGYRVEADGVAMVYLVDHEPFSDELWRAGAEPGRIESILHEGDRRHAKFMADADLVIHDAQYTPEEYRLKENLGAQPYDYAVQIAAAAGVRRVALTHHDPSHNDHFVADIERKARALALQCGTGLDVFCAYEGCELVLEPRSTLKPFVTAAPFQASVAQRRFHILVVDDQPDTLTLIVRALEDEQYIGQHGDERSGGAPDDRRAHAGSRGAGLQDGRHGRHGGHARRFAPGPRRSRCPC